MFFILFIGRDSKVHVFRLSDFENEVITSSDFVIKGRQDLKEHKIERTRGCMMYATSKPGGSHLRIVSSARSREFTSLFLYLQIYKIHFYCPLGFLVFGIFLTTRFFLWQVVCIGKRLLLMQWRHSAAWTAWCPASDTDTVEGFQFIRVSYPYC